MTESQFTELRQYAEASGSCIDMGYRPGAALIRNGWLHEIVRGCWQITPKGQEAFDEIVNGAQELKPDRDTA